LVSACSQSHGKGEAQEVEAHGSTRDQSQDAAGDPIQASPEEDAVDATVQGAAEGDLCAAGVRLPLAAAALSPAQPYDYVAIRQWVGQLAAPSQEESWTVDRFTVISETGEACASASNGDCAAKISHHPQVLRATSCSQLCLEISVVTTRGDEVRRCQRNSRGSRSKAIQVTMASS
jgi:hypothetical protein